MQKDLNTLIELINEVYPHFDNPIVFNLCNSIETKKGKTYQLNDATLQNLKERISFLMSDCIEYYEQGLFNEYEQGQFIEAHYYWYGEYPSKL